MKVLAVGRTSTVVEVDATRVAKVLDSGVPDHWADAEAVFTAEVRRAGASAPEVLDVTTVDGRPAIVLERIVGPSLWQAMLDEPDRVDEFTDLLVAVQDDIHRLGPCPTVPSLRDRMRTKLTDVDALAAADRDIAGELLDGRPAGAALLHGDLHPGNVLLAEHGPVAIDWFDASVGHPAADRARTALLLRPTGATDLRHLPDATLGLVGAVARRYDAAGRPPAASDPWTSLIAASRLSERTDLDTSGLVATWRASVAALG